MVLKNTVETIREKYNRGEQLDFIIFYGHRGNRNGTASRNCLSNFYLSDFSIDSETFICNEQWMMYSKAILFNDEETAKKILSSTEQKEIKHLGREVKNFDPILWNKYKIGIVYKGAYAKFSQNPVLKEYLLNTGDSVLVEGSPSDCIWGIGLRYSLNPLEWRGENLLGFTLMEVRDALRSRQKNEP